MVNLFFSVENSITHGGITILNDQETTKDCFQSNFSTFPESENALF